MPHRLRPRTDGSRSFRQAVELTDLEEPSVWEADDINPDALESHQRALRHQQLQQKRERRAGPPVR